MTRSCTSRGVCPEARTALFRLQYLLAFPEQPPRFRWRTGPTRECLRWDRVSTTEASDSSDLRRDTNAHVYHMTASASYLARMFPPCQWLSAQATTRVP